MAEENGTDDPDGGGAPDIDDGDRLLAGEQNPAQGGGRGGGTDASGVGADLINTDDARDDEEVGGSGGFGSPS